jgi:pectate lyase
LLVAGYRLAETKDERTTIYWNGNITTDSKSPATISFYTADMPTTYTVTIEGIAENGEVIHEIFPIKRTRQ